MKRCVKTIQDVHKESGGAFDLNFVRTNKSYVLHHLSSTFDSKRSSKLLNSIADIATPMPQLDKRSEGVVVLGRTVVSQNRRTAPGFPKAPLWPNSVSQASAQVSSVKERPFTNNYPPPPPPSTPPPPHLTLGFAPKPHAEGPFTNNYPPPPPPSTPPPPHLTLGFAPKPHAEGPFTINYPPPPPPSTPPPPHLTLGFAPKPHAEGPFTINYQPQLQWICCGQYGYFQEEGISTTFDHQHKRLYSSAHQQVNQRTSLIRFMPPTTNFTSERHEEETKRKKAVQEDAHRELMARIGNPQANVMGPVTTSKQKREDRELLSNRKNPVYHGKGVFDDDDSAANNHA
jgi:hypothetical protein